MQKPKILPGQRWMSTAEPELGLGLVLEADPRQVKLFFPASEETRVYSVDSAPIERLVFKVGDTVSTPEGASFSVSRVVETNGLVTYYGSGHTVLESELAATVNLATADRRLLDGRLDTSELFRLRRSAWEHRRWLQAHPAHGYLGARMDLIPHQIYIAREVAERRFPRVLLSDEVGLGKTIEACLILHRLYVRGQSGRVLILVPEPLIHQWFVELYRRFNLTCAIFDEERCSAIQSEAGTRANPFLDEHLVLTSTTLFSKHPERLKEALEADWGLVIVDEAHHLQWSTQEISPEYRMVEAFSKIAPGLLLLTGTPEQFGMEGHFARLRLLDPERFHDYETFCREADHYRETAQVVGRLLEEATPNAADARLLQQWFPDRPHLLKEIKTSEEARETLIDDLLDRQGTGRAVYRNTRAAIPGFPKRRVHPGALAWPEEDPDAPEVAAAEIHFELGQIDKLPRKTIAKDPRIDWLVRLLKKHPEDKFLLICRYRKRAEQISEAVKQRINLPMSIFHEEQTILQRDRNAAWFSQPAPDGARLLICSEIGSEGRNFQFAQHLVLYDLPLDPELLEQRIGRLDRIGQRETIHLHTPYFKGSGGEVLFRWFHEGIDAFAHPIQGGTLYLEKFLPRLRTLLKGEAVDPKALEKVIADTVAFRKILLKKFEQGRDLLLEWHSCRPARVKGLIEEIRSLDQAPALADFLLAAFDHFGVNVEKLGLHESPGGRDHRSWLLTPGHTISDQVSGIPPEGKMITFDRTVALHRDDVDFMTWDHPLVTSLLDLLLGSEAGNAAFSEVKATAGLPAGLYLETVHVLEGTCPARFDLGRFLPSTPLRHLVNTQGQLCPAAFLEKLDQVTPVDAARHALRGQSAALQPLLDRWKEATREAAEVQAAALRQQAGVTMSQGLHHELERLKALRLRNGSAITPEEKQLQEELSALTHALQESRLRLDALRLIRVS